MSKKENEDVNKAVSDVVNSLKDLGSGLASLTKIGVDKAKEAAENMSKSSGKDKSGDKNKKSK